MITVTAAIIQKGAKILITRRAPGKHLAGYWEFPGGKLDQNETEQECLAREIQEELNITIQVDEFYRENIHQYANKQILLKAFKCSLVSGDIILRDHDKMAWINNNELTNYEFAPADIPIVKALLE
ncbi:(deoxy)nucleoside triphosphate pyrophosphohydrolase [Marinilabilia rubra]|uniref:8-oxo-dGTP diphosphatase n=1 Tax=Marinilabilia rubra TaxID=2162893 RepID=A0A2U2B6W7_9BACT|nr:(deoxy)nucleoside triphosphate pyrophosphohydrolase [Marinilabilia rubra]PWD98783.1 8-oxo-dGTP diphosphatase MutT [Marinilabilia rubra]